MRSKRLKILALVLIGAILLAVPGLMGCGTDEKPMEELRLSERNLFPAGQFSEEQLEALDTAYEALSEEDKTAVDDMLSESWGCWTCKIGLSPVAGELSVMSVAAVLALTASSDIVKTIVKALNVFGVNVSASAVVKFLHDTLAKAMGKGHNSTWEIAGILCEIVGAC